MKKLLALPLLFLTLLSCNSDKNGKSSRTLPDANGGILDVIVVAKDNIWKAAPGDALQKSLTQMLYGLPQPEPRFTVRQIEPADYNSLLQRTRYQVVMEMADSTSIAYVKNQHAKGQLIIYLTAPTEDRLAALVKAKNKDIRERIYAKERARVLKRLEPALRETNSKVLQNHGISLALPKDFDLEVEEEDILVYWKKTQKADMGIIVHFRDFDENQNVMGTEIIPIRDSLTEKYILGEREGSFMKVEDLVKPEFNAMEINDKFTIMARGLWRTENDIMGGPFISYTIYDDANDQVVYLDAFLFSPDQKKRTTLFELESILRSVAFLN